MMLNNTIYNNKINEAVDSGITDFVSLDLEVKQRLIKAAFLNQDSLQRKDLIKEAGFSRLLVQNGTQTQSVLVVGGPKIVLKKLN